MDMKEVIKMEVFVYMQKNKFFTSGDQEKF